MNQGLLNLIPEEERMNLLNLSQIATLPEDQKNRALNSILEQILENILTRLSENLTEDDMERIEEMTSSDETHNENIKAYLVSRVPNLDEIIKEEVSSYQKTQTLE